MYELVIDQATQQVPPDYEVSVRCPFCRQRAVFVPAGLPDLYLLDTAARAGLRRCPESSCRNLVFFVGDRLGDVQTLYPSEAIHFDASNLPETVRAAMVEAITCHGAGAYNASALMVRKTLELLCQNRGATGPNLSERLVALRQTVILPTELMEGLTHIRLLGNDAAHVESRVYSDIGREEIELALEVTKEVLKGVYQYDSLVGRLRALQALNRPPRMRAFAGDSRRLMRVYRRRLRAARIAAIDP